MSLTDQEESLEEEGLFLLFGGEVFHDGCGWRGEGRSGSRSSGGDGGLGFVGGVEGRGGEGQRGEGGEFHGEGLVSELCLWGKHLCVFLEGINGQGAYL